MVLDRVVGSSGEKLCDLCPLQKQGVVGAFLFKMPAWRQAIAQGTLTEGEEPSLRLEFPVLLLSRLSRIKKLNMFDKCGVTKNAKIYATHHLRSRLTPVS